MTGRGGRKRAATVRRGLWQRESSGVRPVATVAGRWKMRLRLCLRRRGGDNSGWWQRSRAACDKGGGCGKEVATMGCSGSKEATTGKKGEDQRCRRQMREERKTAQRACGCCDRKGGKDKGSGQYDDDGGEDDGDERSDHEITIGTSKIATLRPNDRTLMALSWRKTM
ncbi:hypothetical protein B296_00031462 [Ensete ventricosum]|uniref:Uncharacterized protein n=1 Tax=Ensete ventricosum TaxID=4639 RepID=A0A426Y6F6_ENSVE|nr:hypothetical protein B296_00031462 [Ensete ventricosum]